MPKDELAPLVVAIRINDLRNMFRHVSTRMSDFEISTVINVIDWLDSLMREEQMEGCVVVFLGFHNQNQLVIDTHP